MIANPPSQIKIIQKYQPAGFEIIYEDRDVIVGIKSAGSLTVRALWNKDRTIYHALNHYVRKGQVRSHKKVFVVHRLDQATSGVMLFAKTPQAQKILKDNWKDVRKIYYALVCGHPSKKEDVISSYLYEDKDYRVHSTHHSKQGKLAQTAFKVIEENEKYSLLEIDLLTGRKNQARVHLAQIGHPIVGDNKYGTSSNPSARLALHSYSISFPHPFTKTRLTFTTPIRHFPKTWAAFKNKLAKKILNTD